jgi:hypothetical protein
VPWLWKWVGRFGSTPLQKMTTAIRYMGYGSAFDSFDEYLKMSERTINICVIKFCSSISQLYENKYLRRLTTLDIQQLYVAHEAQQAFPGMLGSLDCMH